MSRPLAEGDVVLIRARVRRGYAENGMATVRIAQPGSAGGYGYVSVPISIEAIERRIADPDDDGRTVPIFVPNGL